MVRCMVIETIPPSDQHRRAAKARWDNEPRSMRRCPVCGEEAAMQLRQVYCSFGCKRLALERRRRARKAATNGAGVA